MTSIPSVLGQLRQFAVVLFAMCPRRLTACIVLTLGLSATEGIGLLLLIPLLSLVGLDTGSGPIEGVVSAFRTAFDVLRLPPTLGVVLLAYVAVVALQSALQRWQANLGAAVQEQFIATLRTRVYRAIAGAEWLFLAKSRPSDYVHVLVSEMGRVSAAARHLMELGVVTAVSGAYLALAFYLLPAMAAVVVLCGALLGWVVRGKIYEARGSARQASTAGKRLLTAMSDHLAGIKLARSCGLTQRHAEVFGRLSNDLRTLNLKRSAVTFALQQRLSVGMTIQLAGIVYVAYAILDLPTPQMLVLLFLFARVMPRLTQIYQQAQGLAASLPAFDAVIDVERRSLAAAERSSDRLLQVDFRHRLTVEGVTFSYRPDAPQPAIADVDLEIEAGSTTAIVGPSGAGKTTLADLLIGLLSPTRGQILLDGRPLGPANLAAWRAQIGYVPQDTFLFHDTIRANLLLVKPDAGEAELWEALRLAAADEFVRALPKGLDSAVGERGVLISGGERQRLSLARALVRRPRVLVLDEATSSLDSENESRIQRAIAGLHGQVTIVLITHRLSTIRDADVIHLLERGRLVESGTWEELMSRAAGRFRELCHAQGLAERPTAAAGVTPWT